jgi:hypothetical protein
MFGSDTLEFLFVLWAFLFQAVLIVHFSLRKWAFARYTRKYGWLVYALSIPAALVSLFLLLGGKPWSLWLGGLIYLVWGVYGYTIEYVRCISWRKPIRWRIFGPYVSLYLATVMFYWWPLGLISRPLWYAYAILFLISTWLNVTSHRSAPDLNQTE